MKQQTLAEFEKYGKTTRRAQFLAEMDQVVPGRSCAQSSSHFLRQEPRAWIIKLIHTVLASAANVHARQALLHLLHGRETRV